METKVAYFVGHILTKPLAWSASAQERPDVEGCYVDCVVIANSKIDALDKSRTALLEDGYETLFVDMDNVCVASTIKFESASDQNELNEMIRVVGENGTACFGKFLCWTKE